MKEIFVITYKTENNYKCGRMWPNENKIMTVSGRNSDAIFREVIIKVNVKKIGCRTIKVRQPCQPKNDTYETLCVISIQILNICREQVHHV